MTVSNPQRVRRDVGRRIAELRRTRRLTQAEAAEVMGVSVPYVARIEGGTENLTLDTLVKFANLFRVPVAALLEPPASVERAKGRPPKVGVVFVKRRRAK